MSEPRLLDLFLRVEADVAERSHDAVELAGRYGTVRGESTDAVYVAPSDTRLKDLIVSRRDGEAHFVEAQLAEPGSVAVGELLELFGEPRRPPMLAVTVTKLLFRRPAPPEAAFQPVVVVTLDGDESGPITWIGVLRETR